MAVVVDNGDAALAALELEATVDAAEGFQALRDGFGCDFKLRGDGDCGGCVEDIMAAGDVQ